MNPKSLDNLKPFEKGHEPMGGRPKGSVSIVNLLEKALRKEVTHKDPVTKELCSKEMQEWIALKLMVKAFNGDMAAIKEVLERVDGRVTQKTETTGKDGGPIEHDIKTKLTASEIDSRIDAMLDKET